MKTNTKIIKAGISVNKKKYRVITEGDSNWTYVKLDDVVNFTGDAAELVGMTLEYDSKDYESKETWNEINGPVTFSGDKLINVKKSTIDSSLKKADDVLSELNELGILGNLEVPEKDNSDLDKESFKKIIPVDDVNFGNTELYDDFDIQEKELDVSEDRKLASIGRHFDFKDIYSKSKDKKVETFGVSGNRKLQDLLNQTIEGSSRSLYYRTHAKGRSINYTEVKLFDEGKAAEFLNGEKLTLKLSKPKQVTRLISEVELEEKYSPFYSNADYKLFKNKEITWKEFAIKLNKKMSARFDVIKSISNKAAEIKRETGNWVFYAAWPFVTGNTTKSKVRTPLMFTPIKVEYVNGSYLFKATENPIKINSQLIQTIYNENRLIPTDLKIYFETIEDVFREYAKHGILFNNQLGELEGLKTIKKEDFDSGLEINKFKLENIVVFENILKSEDVFNDSLRITKQFGEFNFPESNMGILNNENDEESFDLIPMNIDDNKNHVVSAAMENSVTISGPPGTGKSEAITSILVKSISDGYSNLVVSEKDAALSVLMQRLAAKYNLDDFALKLNGNMMSNKKRFWDKITKTIERISIKQEPKYFRNAFRDSFLTFIEEFNKFKGVIKEANFDEDSFFDEIENIREISSIYKFTESDIKTELTKAKRLLNDHVLLTEELDKAISKLESTKSDYKQSKIECKALLSELKKNLKPPLCYIPFSSINLEQVSQMGNDHKAVFKYLSNKHYGILETKKEFKNNQLKIINMQDSLIKYLNAFKKINIKEEKIDIANQSAEIKKLTRNIEDIENNFLASISEAKETILINDINVGRMQEAQRIFNDFYKEEFDDTYEVQRNFKEKINKIYQDAKKGFEVSTIKYIVKRIAKSDLLKKQFVGLRNMSSYSIGKKHKPGIIIKNYFEVLAVMYPIIIGTPNEISRYLPNDPDIFDYGIFDEASQMFIQRAFPSVHRCKKIIIAGDEKQLAPSNWFKSSGDFDYDEDEEFDYDEDGLAAGSLLGWGLGRYKNKLLNMHYRSKSAKLIEYSNVTYYNSKLKTIDSPLAKANPIELRNVEGKWNSSNNEIEAKEVIATIESGLSEYETIGVVTMNKDQQKLIIELIEENKVLSSIYHNDIKERIFVKNIDNVQGDEADLIIFSIAYSAVDGVMKVGSLNHLTPNRLNVAITRSKAKMIVFNSFKSVELGVGNEGTGKNNLYKWIKWLEENTLDSHKSMNDFIRNHKNTFRSSFEKEFYEDIEKKLPSDIIARTNFVSSGYEINIVFYDMHKEKFIGAIELDGSIHYSDNEGISKDMQKTKFLESLGWNVIRVSSTGYCRNKIETVNEAMNRLNIKTG